MTGHYVPPHLRNRGGSIGNSPDQDKGGKALESGRYTVEDLATHYQTDASHGTLNRSSNDPSSISHILVFKYGHPEWPPKLYCKTNIDLLEHYSTTTATAETSNDLNTKDEARKKSAIPVFIAVRRDSFDFLGYHLITSVTILEPRSEALVSLLEAKFNRGKTTKERRPDQWKESLGMRWAVVTLEKDKTKAGEECGVVKISPKSVTERLNEMRLQDKERKENREIKVEKTGDHEPGSRTSSTESHVLIDAANDVQSDTWPLLSGALVDKTYIPVDFPEALEPEVC